MHDRVSVNALSLGIPPLAEMERYCTELAPRRISFVTNQVENEGEEVALALLQRHGWELETISHPFQMSPLSSDETTWVEPRESLSRLIRFAQKAGGRSIYMVSGGHGEGTWEETAEIFCAAVAPCAQEAREAGVALLIEPAPFFHAKLHLTHTLRDTVMLAEMAGIGVCIDVFSCWTEAGLKETIERAMPICHLVQVGDYICGDSTFPARVVPGDGDIPLRRMLGWILTAGYAGGFDLELIGPRIAEEGFVPACARAGRYIADVIERYSI